MAEHYVGAAGEYLVAAFFMRQGAPVYWPAVPGWVDLAVQTPNGFHRVQVKSTSTTNKNGSIRVRDLGGRDNLTAADRYDLLAITYEGMIWIIPASGLGERDTLTLHPYGPNCPWNGYRKR